MSWIDVKKYVYFDKLQSAIPSLQNDIINWVKAHDLEKDTYDAYGSPDSNTKINYSRLISVPKAYTGILTEIPSNHLEEKHKHDWKTIPCYHNRVFDKNIFPNSWKPLSECRGVYQILINFLRPYGKITPHKDTSNWDIIEKSLKKQVDGYSIVATLQSGMKNKEEKTVGMDVEGIQKFPLEQELVCFDGKRYAHSMWNDTPEWRITAVIDVNKNFFSKGTEKKLFDQPAILPDKPKSAFELEKGYYIFLKEPTMEQINTVLETNNFDNYFRVMIANTLYILDPSGKKHYTDRIDVNESLIFYKDLSEQSQIKLKQYYADYKKYYNDCDLIESTVNVD